MHSHQVLLPAYFTKRTLHSERFVVVEPGLKPQAAYIQSSCSVAFGDILRFLPSLCISLFPFSSHLEQVYTCKHTPQHHFTPLHLVAGIRVPCDRRTGSVLRKACGVGYKGEKFLPSVLLSQTDKALGLKSREASWRWCHDWGRGHQVQPCRMGLDLERQRSEGQIGNASIQEGQRDTGICSSGNGGARAMRLQRRPGALTFKPRSLGFVWEVVGRYVRSWRWEMCDAIFPTGFLSLWQRSLLLDSATGLHNSILLSSLLVISRVIPAIVLVSGFSFLSCLRHPCVSSGALQSSSCEGLENPRP